MLKINLAIWDLDEDGVLVAPSDITIDNVVSEDSSPDMSHTERLTTLAMIPVLNLGEEMG